MIVKNYYQILKSNHSLIDLRSQSEFEKGSFPNAINIPILNDDEREKVGIEFNNFGKNSALDLGKKLVNNSKKYFDISVANKKYLTVYDKLDS